ncbi:MAG: DinB family protein [Planctomycetota bacterium]
MNHVRTYDYLVQSRKRVFDGVRTLTPAQYEQEFPIGLGTIARTLTHIMISEWYYVQRILHKDVPAYETWPIQDESPPAFDILESTWTAQADDIAREFSILNDWSERVVFRPEHRDGPRTEVISTEGDMFMQLFQHEVHHRAQVLNMLRHCGVTVDGLDYSTIMFTRRTLDDDED